MVWSTALVSYSLMLQVKRNIWKEKRSWRLTVFTVTTIATYVRTYMTSISGIVWHNRRWRKQYICRDTTYKALPMYVRMNTCLHTLNNSTITLQYFYDFLSQLHIAQCAIISRATWLPYAIEALRRLKMCAWSSYIHIYVAVFCHTDSDTEDYSAKFKL